MESVYKFYNSIGWKKKNKFFKDANISEDLRFYSREYVSKCRKRILRYIPSKGMNILDFASGPIQYKEYLLYSKNFCFRHCVDFSRDAIKFAKLKIGIKGKFYCKDFFKIRFKKNYFDCILSMHTIYHVDKTKQKKVIEKLLSISKKNTPIIIVYSNPNTIIDKIKLLISYKKLKKNDYYFFCHPITWWRQFEVNANIEFYPWRSFSSTHQKFLIPNHFLGKIILKILFYLEDRFHNFFIKNFQYYTVILKKKN
jgi:2-polyprenyl-3-methyl-5-hydroxy-6-metoxy-1,4-benzoquinol methylase